MAVSLKKGGNVSLTKTDPGLTSLKVGLGWNPRRTDGSKFDLDASLFMLNASGKVRSEADFIFYGNAKSADGSVVYGGDNRTGEGDGDDETITIDLAKVPADITKLVITVTIDEWETRKQNFGMVDGAYARCLNDKSNEELARFDLSEDSAGETAMIFVEIYRGSDAGEWKVKAIGQGFSGGLARMATDYGVNVA
ncbi:TerD family protein [Sphingomonas sp. 3-13AW]|uniref:TerD family protein n=1 Tax=Sphingomonas sp. 3-13AW TaxID=3050450 RepID=UPI003BB4D37E